MIFRFAACLFLCAVGTLSQPARAANEVQCAIQWQGGIKLTKNVKDLSEFLKNCSGSKHAADARKRIADSIPRPSLPSPPPPQFSRCEMLSQTAFRSNSLSDLVSYTGSCASHKNYAEGLRRVQQKRAEQARSQQVRAGEAALREQQAKAEQVQFQEQQTRKKLDTELTRWGLTFENLCGMDADTLSQKANVQPRLPSINSFATQGDSVALLLLGYTQLNEFYRSGVSREDAMRNLIRAAEAGNPRAMTMVAGELMNRVNPDAEGADGWIERAIEKRCGSGFYWKALRAEPTYFPDAPRPAWAKESITALLQTAVDNGHGYSACLLAEKSYPNDFSKGDELYQQATRLGDTCGIINQYVAVWKGKGPCLANKICALNGLKALANSGDALSNRTLYYILINPKFDGKIGNNESFPFLKGSAEKGDDYAMAVLGRSYARGEYGAPIIKQLAINWCVRSYQMGSKYGAACAGMNADDYKIWMDRAYQKKGCELYYTIYSYLQEYFKQIKTIDEIKNRVKNIRQTERLYLMENLQRIKYGLSLYSNSSDVCVSDANNMSAILTTIFEPALKI